MGPEAKLYKKIKKATPTISWNRIENLSIPGMPDALCYNKYNTFFTVEFKVTKSNKVRLSPHQVAWHMRHPYNTFICIQALVRDRDWETSIVFVVTQCIWHTWNA